MQKLVLNVLLALSLVATSAQAAIESPKQVSEHLWVMGIPSSQQLTDFADQGGDIVINLLSEQEMTNRQEAAEVTLNGMAYYHVPVNGAAGVTKANARLVDRILLTHSDKNVLLHCGSSNRVGALMALRAAWFDGQSVEQAIATGQRHGMTSLEAKVRALLEQ